MAGRHKSPAWWRTLIFRAPQSFNWRNKDWPTFKRPLICIWELWEMAVVTKKNHTSQDRTLDTRIIWVRRRQTCCPVLSLPNSHSIISIVPYCSLTRLVVKTKSGTRRSPTTSPACSSPRWNQTHPTFCKKIDRTSLWVFQVFGKLVHIPDRYGDIANDPFIITRFSSLQVKHAL